MAIREKQCIGCGNTKPRGDFYNVKGNTDGLHNYCVQCCKVNRSLESVRKRDKKSKISVRQRHRAIKLGVVYEEGITLAGVFKQSMGICALCDEWVQPRYASMDHTIPLSNGGTHTWDNVQLTHLTCNLRKGAKLL